jgi:Xaa-Pro aminopeptidase
MVVAGAPTAPEEQESRYPFRPGGDLFYLTGCIEPGAVLLLRGGAHEHPATLFVRPRDPEAEMWAGRRLGPRGTAELLGIEHVLELGVLFETLGGDLRAANRIHYRLGSHGEVDRAVGEALAFARGKGTRKGFGPRTVVDPGVILEPLRMRKDARELDALRRAATLTKSAFAAALPLAVPGAREWEVQARLEAVFRDAGAPPAFPTIVAAGANACVLHHVSNRGTIHEGDLVLVDGGAELDLYAGDVSRTVPASGRFTGARGQAYEVVRRAHRAGIETAALGVPVSAVHDACVTILTEGLVALGVLDGSVPELIGEEAYKPFFPHSTSHWLGLDVHDPGVYAREGVPVSLEEGMVLTVEPGLYFSPETPGIPDELSGVGIRLEDDVAVLADGPEVLGGPLPLDPEDVEELMAGGGGGGSER